MSSKTSSSGISPNVIGFVLIGAGLLPILIAIVICGIVLATTTPPKEITLVRYDDEIKAASSRNITPTLQTGNRQTGPGAPIETPSSSAKPAKRKSLTARMPRDPSPEAASNGLASLEALDYAFDTTKRSLVIAGPWQNQLGVAPVDKFQLEDTARPVFIQGVEYVDLTGYPVQVEFKQWNNRDYYVVAQQDPNAIVLINAQEMQVESTLALDDHNISYALNHLIATPHSDSSWVYGLVDQTRKLVRFDLNAPNTIQAWPTNPSIRSFGVSQLSAAQVYLASVNWRLSAPLNVPPTQDTPLPDIEWVTDGARGAATWHDPLRPQADPTGCFVAWNHAYSIDGQEIVGQWQELNVHAPIPGTSLVIGEVDDRLFGIASLSKPDEVINYAYPGGIVTYNRLRRRNKLPMVLQVYRDEGDQRLIIASSRFAKSIPLEFVEDQSQACMVYRQPARTAEAGTEYVYEIRVVLGQPQAELINGPDGMNLEGTTLRWTPTAEQAGNAFEVELDLRDGSIARTAKWQIQVKPSE